ncbi:unnamed protein product [Prorocentrum cordatum]|uniref:Uncharacterized protein n=1 Tax=Prorocentrum cordatum TaxID=2364126 RepID=A0ABN9V4J8_9DINO|nr:unnamed protein product [Polarella glacialis]
MPRTMVRHTAQSRSSSHRPEPSTAEPPHPRGSSGHDPAGRATSQWLMRISASSRPGSRHSMPTNPPKLPGVAPPEASLSPIADATGASTKEHHRPGSTGWPVRRRNAPGRPEGGAGATRGTECSTCSGVGCLPPHLSGIECSCGGSPSRGSAAARGGRCTWSRQEGRSLLCSGACLSQGTPEATPASTFTTRNRVSSAEWRRTMPTQPPRPSSVVDGCATSRSPALTSSATKTGS